VASALGLLEYVTAVFICLVCFWCDCTG